MGHEAMAALPSSVALIARRRRDDRDMPPAWSRSAAALLLVGWHVLRAGEPGGDYDVH